MQIKKLLCFVCLLATTLLSAKDAPIHLVSPSLFTIDKDSCELPPPALFQRDEIGSTWIKLSWGPTSPFDTHRIRTYRVSDDFLLDVTTVPNGGGSATISNLPSNTEIRCEIRKVCNDGSEGPAISFTDITLILDLLIVANQLPSGPYDCNLSGSGQCSFVNVPNTITAFRISKPSEPGIFRKFGITKGTEGGGAPYHVYLLENNNNQAFKFKCAMAEPNCDGPDQIHIWHQTTEIATISVSQTTTTSYLTFSASGTWPQGYPYRLHRVISIPDRNEHTYPTQTHPTAQPNPFSETLDVFLPTQAENIQLQLFNLAGQKVLDQQFTGGQAQYSLSTAALSPGFYLLRIEADGQVQTLKVVKSE